MLSTMTLPVLFYAIETCQELIGMLNWKIEEKFNQMSNFVKFDD